MTDTLTKERREELEETWKPVLGYEGLYEVSDLGRVRNLTFRNRNVAVPRIRLLRPCAHVDGYLVVDLSRNNKRKRMFVHRLVLMSFVGPCPDQHQVAHGNGNRLDNRLSNLRWATQRENNLDKKLHGTWVPKQKKKATEGAAP